MPVLDIDVITRPGEMLPENLANDLANAAADIFASPPGQTWVKLRPLPHTQYAENGGGPPDGVFPVFVTILQAHRPPREQLTAQVTQLCQRVAAACRRSPEHVHILYLPDGVGRIAFGGKLVTT
ncbi:MAG: hypothetical protein KC441_00715 [Anaerolineales bacterium]|nr:hypothetical protein [Anaerolineales bacterium]